MLFMMVIPNPRKLLRTESSPIPKPTEITENITIPLVQEILAADQENLLDKIPEVPASDDAFDDDPISEEKEI